MSADPGGMGPDDFSAAKLAVNSQEQRDALLYACEQVLDREDPQRIAPERDLGDDLGASERRLAEAALLERELEDGCSTVAVGLGIAGSVSGSLAELIETMMRQRAQRSAVAPVGVKIRRAAALMWTLVALEAELERAIMPAIATATQPSRSAIEPTGAPIESSGA